ncbi:Multidrug and toxin extrusion protein 1 [Lamellibrachia satsuma]|nr:Multidrug and toxin extrusion protein 1 [Lamellibrachia satsuma]
MRLSPIPVADLCFSFFITSPVLLPSPPIVSTPLYPSPSFSIPLQLLLNLSSRSPPISVSVFVFSFSFYPPLHAHPLSSSFVPLRQSASHRDNISTRSITNGYLVLRIELTIEYSSQHRHASVRTRCVICLKRPHQFLRTSVFMYIILVKYIQNQNIVLPNVIIGIIANVVNVVMHYVFLYRLHWGTDGSALSQVMAYFTMFALTLLYIIWSEAYKDTWGGWTMDSLQDWGKFARISILGMLMLCMEWWGFEIGVFLTGLLGTTELGAQSVLLQIDSLWFQVPLGIQISTSIRIGQLLGARDEIGAKTAARLSIAIIIMISLVPLTIFSVFQYQLPYLFTNVSDVAALTSKLMPIVMIYLFFDGIATAGKGILCGTGRQVYGAVLLFISYYVLALPIGIPLMFLTWLRSAGYWWALAGNLILQAFVLLCVVMRTDWSYQVKKAQERAGVMGELVPYEDDLTAEENVDERTGLLGSSQSPPAGNARPKRQVSASLSITESIIVKQDKLSTAQIIYRRGSVLFLLSLILGVGVAGNLLITVQPSTSYTNSTTTMHPGFPLHTTNSTTL